MGNFISLTDTEKTHIVDSESSVQSSPMNNNTEHQSEITQNDIVFVSTNLYYQESKNNKQ